MTPVLQTAVGLAIPFVGTALGAAAVFLFKSNIPPRVQKILLGFASGVMLAASVWSLLLPALELSGSWLPVVVGFLVGIGFLLGLDQLTARLHLEPKPGTAGANSFLLVLAVTLHNVPEGMAVGVAFAGMLAGDGAITPADAFALAVGIALQNIPEGTIVAAPLRSDGCSRSRSFVYGVLSGAVEPVGAVLTILLTALLRPVLPFLLACAAGAMVYVVLEELNPQAQTGSHGHTGTMGAAAGFALMMAMDVALG